MTTPKLKLVSKPGPKEELHAIDLPFGVALGRMLSAKPPKRGKSKRKAKPKTK
jgi:hypothetical protein